MDPVFLTLEEVLEIHTDMLTEYGGSAGIRDLGLFKSAIAMPAAMFGGQYLHGSLYEMAAAYLFHIVQNHPFVDGNKRTGAAAAAVFLELNGLTLNATEDGYYDLVISVSQGKLDKSQITEFFRDHTKTN